MTYLTVIQTPIASVTAASDGQAIVGLWFEGQKYFGSTVRGESVYRQVPVFTRLRAWLNIYFCGRNPDFTLPLAPSGSAFRQDVWKLLRAVEYGQTVTYGQLAALIAAKSGRQSISAQAVGGAVGHNPISILIPCHRVVGSSGALTGYAAGVGVKRQLLELEGVCL